MTDPVHAPPLPRVSVVVLAYKSERWLTGCLDALADSRGVDLEIICIDNASGDRGHEIAQAHPATTKAIRLEQNLGCAGGNDFGWRAGTAPYVVFINPDCRVMPDTVAQLIRRLEEDDTVGVVGARLLYPNTHTIQHAGGILHPNSMCEHIGVNKPDSPEYRTDREVDYVTGALMAFRRRDLEAVDGFDPEYFPAYYEETDLIVRLKRRGLRALYAGGALAYHWESVGLTKDSVRFVRTSYKMRIRFVIKNYSVAELLTKFLPFEASWFFGPFAKGFRCEVVRSYLSGLAFAARCLVRFSRRGERPKGRG